MDGSTDDIAAENNPSAVNAVSFELAMVDVGAWFGIGGFIDVPHAANLANQQFTIDAWVRPDGPGPTDDQFGSIIISKGITGAVASLLLSWRGSDSRFVFAFGSITEERIISSNSFPPGQFYHVAATYDGAEFKLYVDGALEGEFALAKTITYNRAMAWAIGANPWDFRPPNNVYPRTWNGVIDEVEVFNRALTHSEIQSIVDAGGSDRCKVRTVDIDIKPGYGVNIVKLCPDGVIPVAILGSATFDVQDVDAEHLRFAGAAEKAAVQKDADQLCSFDDVNGDQKVDLVCHFVATNAVGIDGQWSKAIVNGELQNGTPFSGVDRVNVEKDKCQNNSGANL